MAKKKTKSADISTMAAVESEASAEPIVLAEEPVQSASLFAEPISIASEPSLQSQYDYQQTFQNERNDLIMSCKSAIYTANTASTAVAVNGVVPLGSVIRRFGCAVSSSGNAINLNERGYYNIDISATFTASAAGNVTLTVFQNGVAIPGATATTTITTDATQVASLSIPAVARVLDSCSTSAITVVLTGTAATFSNVAAVVNKL